jgi:hypothetical protein
LSSATQSNEEQGAIDPTSLIAIGDGAESFVMALVTKMCNALPEDFTNMDNFCADLKSAAHKAKPTFAYSSLDGMKNQLKDIKQTDMDLRDLDHLPIMASNHLIF